MHNLYEISQKKLTNYIKNATKDEKLRKKRLNFWDNAKTILPTYDQHEDEKRRRNARKRGLARAMLTRHEKIHEADETDTAAKFPVLVTDPVTGKKRVTMRRKPINNNEEKF